MDLIDLAYVEFMLICFFLYLLHLCVGAHLSICCGASALIMRIKWLPIQRLQLSVLTPLLCLAYSSV